MKTHRVLAVAIVSLISLSLAASAWAAVAPTERPVTAEAINDADLRSFLPPTKPRARSERAADPTIVKIEILLDRVGASPGVIDGFDGENLRKAVAAYEVMLGQTPDGRLTVELLQRLQTEAATSPVVTTYAISQDDLSKIGPPIPTDYAEMAHLKFLGYSSVAEELAERFHMDQKLLTALNPGVEFSPGQEINVAAIGEPRSGKVARIEADKGKRQVRGYGSDGRLLVAYPATIGSTDTPSPSGHYEVASVAHDPTYTYNPKLNFKQANNDQILVLPPGPNGPVGSVWIALSKPTFGIHGTAEPNLIDKAASHGCVRLTNWDAEELSHMVEKGVPVDFAP